MTCRYGCDDCDYLGPSGRTREAALERWNALPRDVTPGEPEKIIEMKPCPVCDFRLSTVVVEKRDVGVWNVRCRNCDLTGPRGGSEVDARLCWNALLRYDVEQPLYPDCSSVRDLRSENKDLRKRVDTLDDAYCRAKGARNEALEREGKLEGERDALQRIRTGLDAKLDAALERVKELEKKLKIACRLHNEALDENTTLRYEYVASAKALVEIRKLKCAVPNMTAERDALVKEVSAWKGRVKELENQSSEREKLIEDNKRLAHTIHYERGVRDRKISQPQVMVCDGGCCRADKAERDLYAARERVKELENQSSGIEAKIAKLIHQHLIPDDLIEIVLKIARGNVAKATDADQLAALKFIGECGYTRPAAFKKGG